MINFILLFIKMLFHILLNVVLQTMSNMSNARKYSECIYAVKHQYHFSNHF